MQAAREWKPQERAASRLDSIGLSPTERASLKEIVNEALLRHYAQWDKKDEAQQEAYLLDLARLLKECGLSRFQEGMWKSFTWNPHLPSAPEVRECLPPAPDVVINRATHNPSCGDCNGTGFKCETFYSDLYRREACRVRKCDCNTRPHRPHKVADTEDAAWIKQKVAELDAAFSMPAARTPYRPKPVTPSAPPAIPIVQFTAEQIQQRKPAERAEIERVEYEIVRRA